MKEQLIQEFFELGGNYKNIDKARILEKKVNDYLNNTKENDELLLDVRGLLEVFQEERQYDDFEEACKIIFPTVRRLTHRINLDFNDIRISQYVITWAGTFEEAEILARRALSSLNKYIKHEAYIRIKFFIHFNLLIRLIKADFIEIDAGEELERSQHLEKIFKEHLYEALAICEGSIEEFQELKIVLLIRAALFDRDYVIVDMHLKNLKDIASKELYKTVRESIRAYSAYGDFSISNSQFNVMCGSHLKKFRKKYNLTQKDVAITLNYKIAQVSAIERGERGLSAYHLFKLAKKYDVTLDELCCGIDDKSKLSKSKEDIELERIRVLSVGLGVDWLETVSAILEQMQKQKRLIEKKPYLIHSLENDDDDTEE
jgi:transcriptional regulator with XRE-family HTH domain